MAVFALSKITSLFFKNHSHFPDPIDIEKRKIRTALKTRAVVADEPPRQTILSVQRDINRDTAAVTPS